MFVDISERAFEDAIEASLIQDSPDTAQNGASVVAEARRSYLNMPSGGYRKRLSEDYDRALCLIPRDVLDFVLATQPQEWKRLCQHHGSEVEQRFLKRLATEIGRKGTLHVLRNGIRDMGCKFQLAYFRPASGLNEETRQLYKGNLFSVVRQLHYSEKNEKSLDLVLFLNGLPIFTVELKNPLTGQTVEDAIRQYKRDRDPRELLFNYGRCLAHFASRPGTRLCDDTARGAADPFPPLQPRQVWRGWKSTSLAHGKRLRHLLSVGGDLGAGQCAGLDEAVRP